MDLLRPFRRCFFCKSSKNLIRVEHPGYNTTYHYYHHECLKLVQENPESHPGYVDTAIQIADQIRNNRLKIQERIRDLETSSRRLRSIDISGGVVDTQNTTQTGGFDSTMIDLAEGILAEQQDFKPAHNRAEQQATDLDLSDVLEKEKNKFKKIFGEET